MNKPMDALAYLHGLRDRLLLQQEVGPYWSDGIEARLDELSLEIFRADPPEFLTVSAKRKP